MHPRPFPAKERNPPPRPAPFPPRGVDRVGRVAGEPDKPGDAASDSRSPKSLARFFFFFVFALIRERGGEKKKKQGRLHTTLIPYSGRVD